MQSNPLACIYKKSYFSATTLIQAQLMLRSWIKVLSKIRNRLKPVCRSVCFTHTSICWYEKLVVRLRWNY